MLLTNLSPLNKVALVFFGLTKIFGFIGVCLGFSNDYQFFGGCFLILAFISISISITCATVQTTKDKIKFADEDIKKKEIASLLNTKRALEDNIKKTLEEEIRLLEAKRNALTNYEIRKGKQ